MRMLLNHRLAGLLSTLPLLSICAAHVASSAAQSAQSKGNTDPPQSVAVAPTLVRVDAAAARRFDTAFASIAEQAHVLIVSEGTPLHTSLTDKQIQDLDAALPTSSHVVLHDALARLAAAYDYTVERTDTRTFLLVKRYSDPADLPCVTYDEIVHALRSVVEVVDGFSPVVPSAPAFKSAGELYDSMTAQQAQKAKAGIRLADLNPEQQELALSALSSMFADPHVNNLRQMSRSLAALNRRSTVFEWVDAKLPDQSPTKAFGFQGAIGHDDAVVGVPITYPFKMFGRTSYTWIGTQHSSIGIPQPGNPGPEASTPPQPSGKNQAAVPLVADAKATDPTAPTALDRSLADGMLADRLPSTLTLLEATSKASLLRSAIADEIDRPNDLPYGDVDEAVASKPVNVFGFEFSGDKRHFMEALAGVYGLQLVVGNHQRIALELPTPDRYVNLREVPQEIARLIPPPLKRAFASESAFAAEQQRQEKEQHFALPVLRDGRTYVQLTMPSYDAFYFADVRRLIAFAEPSVPTPQSSPVAIAKLGPEASRLIALTMLSQGALGDLVALENYVPSQGLMQPDKDLITMNSNANAKEPSVSMAVMYPSRNGRYTNGGVYGSVLITPRTTFSGTIPKSDVPDPAAP